MKTLRRFVALTLLLATPVVARGQTNNTTTLRDVRQAGSNALVTTGKYTQQQIQDMNRSAEKQFRELGKKLDDLKASAQSHTGQARSNMDARVAEAQKKLDELKPKLKELKTAATNTWAQVKSAFDQGIEDIKQRLP
ncbi:MAG TPA: hypothetical protein VMV72_04685 [Verrucomicrobiae bacterium]|nr:hypothetical protein [Verrucomicrobiae bacterium]